MARKIKLLGGRISHRGEQCRCILLASSQKQAAEILGVPISEIRNFFCETGNETELSVADGFESGVWVARGCIVGEAADYVKIKE